MLTYVLRHRGYWNLECDVLINYSKHEKSDLFKSLLILSVGLDII